MLRAILSLLSLACLALMCALATNCGGSSGSGGGGCTGGPYDVVGDWTLNVTGSGGGSGPGLINSAGLAVFFENSVPLVTVTLPAITGTCSFTGTATAYAANGQTATDTVQGNVNSATSISGKISNGNTFSLVPNTPLTGSVTALSGSGWEGELEGETIGLLPLTFTPSGNYQSMSVAGTEAGCSVSGTFNQEVGSSTNVFDVSLTFSGASGCLVGTVSGLGYEASSDYFGINGGASGTYLYAISSGGAEVMEVYKPAP